nr:inverse autotransporter beta domain-containing protein [Methylococcus sp. EFPC2]
MSTNTKCGVTLGLVSALGLGSAHAAQSAPANLEEMWKIIQQQQKEIEALKGKAQENEALKEEVKSLKAAQETQTKSAPPAVADAGGKGAPAKTAVERKTDILATEVEKLKTQLFIPESREYKSQYGLGPAASQVYRVNRGLSIGGYGEAMYTNYTANKGSNKDSADLLRAVIYAGYKFNDWIILNNEIEFEHATTGEGSEEKGEVSVEFSQLDFLLHKNANIRAGLMLMPMGFINEMHEPTTFHGNIRPDVERYIIPSTWREVGAGLFGEVVPDLQYRMYAVNGLNAEEFSNQGIREGRQGGSKAAAENFAFTGRLDYTPSFAPGLLVGASTFLGNAAQDNFVKANGKKADVFTQLYEGHVQWHYRGLEVRALGAWGHIGDAGLVSRQNTSAARDKDPTADDVIVGKENYGWYTEAAYDIMPLLWKESTQYLAPFLRYERYDTIAQAPDGFDDDRSWDRRIYQGGLTYKPIPNISIKADYRNISAASGQRPHEFNLGVGFIY